MDDADPPIGENPADVGSWLVAAGLGAHADTFRDERISVDQLSRLTDGELRELGLPLGDRIRFRDAVARDRLAYTRSEARAERRPLTVVFLDLVDSTGLSQRVEAEDVFDIHQRYHDACIGPIQRYGGQVTRYLGDAIRAYFCYPVAHEDDPERAVRAALEAAAAVGRLTAPDGAPLALRAGIATGRVVVGALAAGKATAVAGEPNQALGATPNLAARLQSLARPGGVVISAETAHRLRDRFVLKDLGLQDLRGFDEPVHAFEVQGERPRTPGLRLGPAGGARFVGRRDELAALDERWNEALDGRGSAVIVRGEAGIGKSRLVRQFIAGRLAARASLSISIAASSFNVDEPLWPVAMALRGLVRPPVPGSPTALRRLGRLLLDRNGPEEGVRLAAVAKMLGMAGEREDGLLADITPAQLRALTLEVLSGALARAAAARPLVLLVEDTHWLDPTTLDLVEQVVAGASGRSLLVLMTAREEFGPPPGPAWAGVATVDLKGLDPAEAEELFGTLCDSASPGLGRELAARTGGVPMFLEEFAHAVRETRPADGALAAMPAVPATLDECLAARLDRAGSDKELAQVCAVLGPVRVRAENVAAVAGLPVEAVTRALTRLERAGVLWRSYRAEGQSWTFRHALLHEAAYASLVRDRRRTLHSRVADAVLEGMQPAILAYHLSEAGRGLESTPHFLAAARESLVRSALQEATRLLRRGLEAVGKLPESRERDERRLELMSLLGPALIGLSGPGSTDAQELYAEAVTLARSLPPRAESFPIFWGWWRLSHLRDFHESRKRAAWLYAEAKNRGERELLLQAHHSNWASLFHQGDLCGCERHAREGLALYSADEHGGHASLYGNHDAKVCGHAHRALGLWQRGLARAADREEARALQWAHQLGHAGTILHALEFATTHRAYRQDPDKVGAANEHMADLAEEHGFREYRARCRVFRGWAMAMAATGGGAAREGAAIAVEGLAMEHETNTADDLALFHCLVAEARNKAGDPEGALAGLSAARDEFERIGLRYWLPEVWRTIGDLTLEVDPTARTEAALAYDEANRIAEEQGARRLVLRAALGTARLELRAGGEGGAAAARLAAALRGVPEAEEDAPDVRAAETLLAGLGGPPPVPTASGAHR
jgi:predicted ATPase/class 3 adenylate cyclase